MPNFTSISYTLGYQEAYRLYQSFVGNTAISIVGYVMVGRSLAWDGTDTVPAPQDTEATRYETASFFLGGKRITGNDVYLVIPRVNWTANVVYTPYDDTSNVLFTSTNSMFVYVATGEVYKCIHNANNAYSTISPTGNYTTTQGFQTPGDGYVWKYMYKVPSDSKFLTDAWIPVPTSQTPSYFGHANNLASGAISHVVVSVPGNGYGTTNTTIVITGSGIGANAIANVSAAGNVRSITVDDRGIGYTRQNTTVRITSPSGSGANARVIISPYGGHGFNPARELGANTIMLSVKIGDVDATETGHITANNDFRQIGLLMSPHKYGENTAVSIANADIVVTMVYQLVLTAGSAFTVDEMVYQGTSLANAVFSAYVSDIFSNAVECIGARGTPRLGYELIGVDSAISRTVVAYVTPDLDVESGDLVYTENRAPVVRSVGQGELIKIALRF